MTVSLVKPEYEPDPNLEVKHYDAFIYRDKVGRELWRSSVPKTNVDAVEYLGFVHRLCGVEPEHIQGRVRATGTPRSPERYESIEWSIYDPDSGEWNRFVPTLVAESDAADAAEGSARQLDS